VLIYLRRRYISRQKSFYQDIWPIDEKAKLPPPGWNGWPDGKKFALILTHDVETEEGQEKCVQLADRETSLGFKSSFNFIAKQYKVSLDCQEYLKRRGFEVGLHGLYHNGDPFQSRKVFQEQVTEINYYLKEWDAVGFRCPSMYHNLDWIGELNVEYDSSTFDTDPFEPQPDGVGTIFPFWVRRSSSDESYLELPYTLPQDHTLFVIMREKTIDVWKKKLDWIANHGGMALLITHPDYMNCKKGRCKTGEYPMEFYEEFLAYIRYKYAGQYWHPLPKEIARFWKEKIVNPT
jgi:peptidoglycan/xylan/chitin deacetylase (PgdA/CDA1 family)